MGIEVRFYAHLRDAVGQKTVSREYEGPVTVGDVLADLAAEFPDLSGAVFADDGETLEDGDTLAITPQVVGGRPPVRAREFHDRPRI